MGDKEDDILKLELARSESGVEPWHVALDGGRSFISMSGQNSTAGTAFRSSFNIGIKENLRLSTYYNSADADFVGATFSERGLRRGGAGLKYAKNNYEYGADFTRAFPRPGASDMALLNSSLGHTSLRLAYAVSMKDSAFKVEYLKRSNLRDEPRFNIKSGVTDGIALRYDKKMSERIGLYVEQQVAFESRSKRVSSLGVKYKMRKNIDFTAEGSVGSGTTGGRFGFEKTTDDGTRMYIKSSTGQFDIESSARTTATAAGVSAAIGKDSSVDVEYGAEGREAEKILRRTLRLNRKYDAGGGLIITMSAERSEEKSSLSGAYTTNSGGFSAKHNYLGIADSFLSAEFRRNTESICRQHFALRFTSEIEATPDLGVSTEYIHSVSSSSPEKTTDEKFTKSALGFAYRPNDHNKIGILAKAARLRELRSPTVGSMLNPDITTTVLSLEGIYEIAPKLNLKEKIASKHVKESAVPLPTATTHTVLWITGLDWRPIKNWDFSVEYRTRHQPTQLNRKKGFSLEIGKTIKKDFRLGYGYNFSSFSDDALASDSYSYRGSLLRVQMKK
jgi:hypothetical protein